MPNSRHRAAILSPSFSRITKRIRSSITEHFLHGMFYILPQARQNVLPMSPERSVTYVSGCTVNRHVVGEEESLQERKSDSILALSLAGETVRFPPKRRQGYRWAGLLSFEKDWIRAPTSSSE